MEKLEREFLENGGEFRKERLDKYFFNSNGDIDIQVKDINNRGEYVVSSGFNQRGIIGKTDIDAKIIKENCLTIDMFGNVYARNYPFKMVTHARVFSLIPRTKMSIKALNYIAATLFFLNKIYGYSNMATWDKISVLKLELPFLNGKMNFSYMEKFIEELEAERIEELEAYLMATGLKDYKLTKEDEKILDVFEKISDNSLYKTRLDKIRLEDLMTWQSKISEIDPLKLNELYDKTSEKYPFYGQATDNNGIISYESLKTEVLNNKNSLPTILVHSNNQNVVYLQSPFYLKDGHGATSVLQNENMDLDIALYIMACIRKSIAERFDYNAKATKIGLKNTEVEVPFYNGVIDYKFMKEFIKVIKKLIIKDVVIWSDKKIEVTKQVISKR